QPPCLSIVNGSGAVRYPGRGAKAGGGLGRIWPPRPTRALAFATAVASPPAVAIGAEPVKVIVVGTFHMSNPGHDIHNMKVDDVLAAKRQAEIADVTDRLAAFKPTKVMAEWPAELVAERDPKYVAGTLPPSRNEVVQLGFRLARSAGAQGMYGIDVDGDFPFEAVQTFAKAHGQEALLQSWLDAGGREVKALTEMLASHSIG